MTITKRLIGVLAILALAAILIGAPALLWTIGQPHRPAQLPTWTQIWSALTSRDDGTLIVIILFIVAWVAWLYLAIALLVEIAAAIRQVPAPSMPGFSLPQGLAKRLVGAAMLAFMTAPALAGISTADTTDAPPPAVATTTSTTQTSTSTSSGAPAEADAPMKVRDVVEHVVGPRDTLSGLARQYLGDPDRYPEIFEANRGVQQANGSLLTDPDLIVDGTVLRITLDTSKPTTLVRDVVEHVVGPRDTLSGLARQYLGDPDRYPEIFEANRGVQQANGSLLTDPDLIVDGTVLRITLDTTSPTTDHEDTTASTTHEPATDPEPTTATPEPATNETFETTPAATPTASTTAHATTAPTPTTSSTAQQTVPAQIQPETSHPMDDSVGIRTAFGVGGIAAAGLVGLIAHRRLIQRRKRHRGAQLAMPYGAAAAVEHQLRTVGDPIALEDVDRALRSLARHCRDFGIGLPDIRVARLTSSAFEIYLNEPEQLPAPWTGIADGTLWSWQSDRTEDSTTPPDAEDIPAPYPALVTLGQDSEGAHILVDLESVGQVNVQGPQTAAEQVLAAMALELATSHWADDLTVTVIGAWPEMEDTLKTGNIRYLPTVGRLFQELQKRADDDRLAMTVEEAGDLHHARVTATAPSTWFPEIVFLTQPLTPQQQEQLQGILNGLPRVAIASVAISDQASEWAITLTDDEDTATLNPLGLTITPQRISTEAYHSLLEVVDLTNHQAVQNELSPAVVDELLADASDYLNSIDTPSPVHELSTHPAEQNAAPAEDIDVAKPTDQDEDQQEEVTPGETAVGPVDSQPYLRLLGQVELIGAEGPVEESRKARFTEYLAYLLLTPEAKPAAIDEAIWPNRRKQDNTATRNPATSRLRKWLGTSDDGTMRLDLNTYKITDVGCDWTDFQNATEGPLEELTTPQLQTALSLVHGAPLKGVSVRYWAWAEPVQQQMYSRIVDACYELAVRQIVDEDYHAAETTLALGLDVEPGDEQLWRMRILAAHARHNQPAVEEATNRLFAQLEAFDCTPEPATDELLRLMNKGATVTDLMEMI